MSKIYTLQSISMYGGQQAVWTDSNWTGYSKKYPDPSVCMVGYASSGGGMIYATNILFNASVLASLRTKTVISIKLVITVKSGTLWPSTSSIYQLGYKLNGENGVDANTGGNGWTRSDADSTAAGDTTITYINGQKDSRYDASNTQLTFDITGSSVPKYGYVIGCRYMTTANITLVNSATLLVTTNENDYDFTLSYNANGGSGAPASQRATGTMVGTPQHTFTISSTVPTRDGYFFSEWKTGNTTYQPGGTITVTANTTLYAQWSPAQSVISNVTSSVPIDGSSKVTVNITRYSSSFTHTVTFTLGSRTTTLTGQGTTVRYAIPTSWLDQLPTSTSGTATVSVVTMNGSTQVGSASSRTFKVTVPASVVPTATLTSDDVNSNATINNWNVLVQGYSKIKLDVVAAAGAGSEIQSIIFSGDGVSQSGTRTTVTSSILTITGNRTWTCVVTDKRGRSVTKTVTRPVYAYSIPSISAVSAYRSDSSGSESVNEGTYASAKATFGYSSIGGYNSLTSRVISYKIHTASSYTTAVSSAESNTLYTIGGGNISLLYVYDVKFEITDAIGNTVFAVVQVNSVVGIAFGLNNDRARFGGPVQKAGLQVDWDAEFNGVLDVTQRRCFAMLSSAGWYRAIKINAIGSAAVSFSIDIDITREYSYANNEVHSIKLLAVYSGNVSFVNEQSKSAILGVDKIRYTVDGNGNGYIDVHYSLSVSNGTTVDFKAHTRPNIQGWFVAESLQAVADAPSGETVLTTYELAANTYGGMRYYRESVGSITITSNGFARMTMPSQIVGRKIVNIITADCGTISGGAMSIMSYTDANGNARSNYYMFGSVGASMTNAIIEYWYL